MSPLVLKTSVSLLQESDQLRNPDWKWWQRRFQTDGPNRWLGFWLSFWLSFRRYFKLIESLKTSGLQWPGSDIDWVWRCPLCWLPCTAPLCSWTRPSPPWASPLWPSVLECLSLRLLTWSPATIWVYRKATNRQLENITMIAKNFYNSNFFIILCNVDWSSDTQDDDDDDVWTNLALAES